MRRVRTKIYIHIKEATRITIYLLYNLSIMWKYHWCRIYDAETYTYCKCLPLLCIPLQLPMDWDSPNLSCSEQHIAIVGHIHGDVMAENVTGLLWGESSGLRWFHFTKGQWWVILMLSLMSIWTAERQVNWAILTLIWRHCNGLNYSSIRI